MSWLQWTPCLCNSIFARSLAKIDAFSKPPISAVNGCALGAGFELVLHSDMVICGENARFVLPEITLGMLPGAGGTQRLARLVDNNSPCAGP